MPLADEVNRRNCPMGSRKLEVGKKREASKGLLRGGGKKKQEASQSRKHEEGRSKQVGMRQVKRGR